MLTERLDRVLHGFATARNDDDRSTLVVEPIAGQMTVDEVIASFRCLSCDAPLAGHRAECGALLCHDCD
jgi:hypothetical protein